MSEDRRTITIVGEWVAKAENDLRTATHTLKLAKECPTDTVCFHSQQCVEKYLKAYLVLKKVDFPKTHDIGEITALMPENIRIGLSVEEQRRLTSYATVTRYPGDYEPIPLAESRQAVKTARQVRKEMRRLLPKEALPRRKK